MFWKEGLDVPLSRRVSAEAEEADVATPEQAGKIDEMGRPWCH